MMSNKPSTSYRSLAEAAFDAWFSPATAVVDAWRGALQERPGDGRAAGAWPTAPTVRSATRTEEVVPLGEEVLEVGKRTENRGTVRVHRYVVETPVERQVALQSERVVVERRRPADDRVTGEVLTEVAVEVVETAEVPVVGKRARLREEVVVRTERAHRLDPLRATVRRDEVEIRQPGKERGAPRLRTVDAGR